jgi:hypothetical protein
MTFSRASQLAVAALALASKATAAAGKRGLNYNNATWANYFVGNDEITWGYNWGWPSNGLDASFEFVPMLWGVPTAPDPDWITAASAAKNCLTYNEPDLTSQANIIPSVASDGYKAYVQPLAGGTVRLGGPAVTNAGYGVLPYIGLGWLDSFLADCTGCQIDFMPVHWYDNASAATFENYLTEAHTRSGKPIWITEFMLQDSEANQIAFLQEVMVWMDAQDWIERYSYFGVFEDFLINGAGDGLSNIGKTYATYTG